MYDLCTCLTNTYMLLNYLIFCLLCPHFRAHVRVWRLILKNAKEDFAMFGLQVYFFVKVFVEGGTLLPLFMYKTLIINRK
jgi:hypothetical protein